MDPTAWYEELFVPTGPQLRSPSSSRNLKIPNAANNSFDSDTVITRLENTRMSEKNDPSFDVAKPTKTVPDAVKAKVK